MSKFVKDHGKQAGVLRPGTQPARFAYDYRVSHFPDWLDTGKEKVESLDSWLMSIGLVMRDMMYSMALLGEFGLLERLAEDSLVLLRPLIASPSPAKSSRRSSLSSLGSFVGGFMGLRTRSRHSNSNSNSHSHSAFTNVTDSSGDVLSLDSNDFSVNDI